MAKEFDEEDLFDEDLFADLDFDSTPGSAPPKGVKGYFKNVAKSGKNVVIGFGRTLMPQSTETIKGISEIFGGVKNVLSDRKEKMMRRMQAKKGDSEGVISALKKSVNETLSDWKERVKTGKFVKGEDDIDFNAMMADDSGDEETDTTTWYDDIFGKQDDSYSYNESEDNTIEEMSEGGTPSGGVAMAPMENKINNHIYKKTIIQGADTLAITKMQGSSTVALINAYNANMRQQQIAEEARHREKMLVLTNIQKNQFKSASFLGGLYKSSNEFYRKALRGLIDVHGMLKERREMDIEIYKHEQDVWRDNRVGTADVFGMGSFNADNWLRGVGQNIKQMFDYSALGELYSANQMMGDIGKMTGQKTSMLSMLLNPFNIISNTLVSGANRIGFQKLDKTIAGLPAIFNNMLMGLSNKGGVLGKIGEAFAIRDEAGYIDASKYAVRDLKKPTAWDFAARQSLVEVIPGYLSQILAAVSGKEELYYDHKTKSFKTVKSLKNRYLEDRKIAMNSDYEFSTFNNTMSDTIYNEFVKNGGKLSKTEFDKMYTKMMDNMGMMQQIYNTDVAQHDDYYRSQVMRGMGSNDTANKMMLDTFNSIMLNPEQFGIQRQQVGGLQRYLATFKGLISRMHKDFGSYESDDGLIAMTQRAIGNTDRLDNINNQIKKLDVKIEKATTSGAKAAFRRQKAALMTELSYLKDVEGIQPDILSKEGKSSYERSLIDASTGGGNILQRIYETLIHGVVVFPQKMPKELWEQRKDIIDYMGQVKTQMANLEDAKEEESKLLAKERNENLYEQQKAARSAQSGEGLGAQLGVANWGVFKYLNKLTGKGIDSLNDILARYGFGGDTQKYANQFDDKDSGKLADDNWNTGINTLEKWAKKGGVLGSLAKWGADKARTLNAKRQEYNYKSYKDGEDAANKVMNFGRDVYNKIRKKIQKPKKEEELVLGEDIPVKIKPKRFSGYNNGSWIILATSEDWNILKPYLDKLNYNYTSATEGIDGLSNTKGIFISEKFRNSGDYSDFIKDAQKLKQSQEGKWLRIFYQIDGTHGLKYFIENEAKISVGKALSSENIEEMNAQTFEGSFMKRDRGKMPGNVSMDDSYTTIKSEHRTSRVDMNLDVLTSNFRSIEGQLDRIISLIDRSRDDSPVSVQNMEDVISLLTIIANKTNEGSGTIDLKDIEKAFNRQRKAGMKDKKKGNIVTRALGAVIKAPFKFAGWGIKNTIKGAGFALGLIPNLLGGLIGGIAGGLGKALPGIGSFVGSTIGLLGRGAGALARGIGGIGGKLLGAIPAAGRLFTKGLGKVGGALKWGAGKVWDGTKWVGRNLKGAAGKLKGAGRWVKDKATGAWKWVKKKASWVGATFKDTVHNIAGNIGQVAGKVGRGIAKFAGGIAGSFMGAFAGPFWKKAMLENLVQVRLMLEGQYGPVDPSVISSTMKSYGAAKNLTEGVTKIAGAAKEKIGGVIQGLKGVPGAIKDKLGNKIKGVKGVIGSNIETMQIQAMLLADAMKEKAGNVKKKLAGFIDRGDGSGIREGSAEDIKRDKAEKMAAERSEEMHAAALTTAAATSALLDKDFGGGKDATGGGIQALGLGLSSMALGLGKRGMNFVKNIFKRGGKAGAKKGFIKRLGQRARISGKKIAAFGRGLVKQAKNFKSLFTQGGKFASVGKTLGRIGKFVSNSKVGKFAKGVAKPLAKIVKWIGALLGKLFKNKTIVKRLGPKAAQTMAKTLPTTIAKGLPKAGPKIIGKLTAKIGTAATGVGAFALAAFEIVTGVWAFTKNWMNAGQLFGLQDGEKPTLAMRATAGIVGALNNLLVGIPSLIFGMEGLVQMVYKLVVGSLPDENKWKEERAKIYGIMKNWQAFDMTYKAPGTTPLDMFGLKRMGNGLGQLAVGKWRIFGFQSKKIYDKWKKDRFQPLKDLEDKLVDTYGGSKNIKDNTDDFQAFQDAFRKAANELIKSNNVEHLNTETKDEKEPKTLNGMVPAMSKGMAAAALTGAVTSQAPGETSQSTGEGSSPNATGGNVEAGSSKQGILQKALSFASKNKGKLLLLGLLGPGALLLTKGAQMAWNAIKSGVKFVGDKIGSFVDWAKGGSRQVAGAVQDKVMEMIQGVLAGASNISDGFKMAFDIIKSYIARFTESGADRAYADDTYQYGLSYNKNKTVLKEKFGINGPEEMHNLKMSDAVWIYYTNYYEKLGKMGELSKNDRILAYHYFHHVMDAGKEIADQMMKQCEKLDPALRSHCFVQLRLNYYRELAQKDQDKKNMLPFWERNVFTLNKELGFEFKEGQSYNTEIDSKTDALAKSGSSASSGAGASPNASSNSYSTSSSNTSTSSSYVADNPEMEDVGTSITGGGSNGGSSPVSYSTAFGSSTGSNGLVGGGNNTIVNKTSSMDFKNLEDFIKKELEYLENIQVNTNNAVIALAQVNQTLSDGFNKLIELLGKNKGNLGIAEQIAEGVL